MFSSKKQFITWITYCFLIVAISMTALAISAKPATDVQGYTTETLFDDKQNLKIVLARYDADTAYFFCTWIIWCDTVDFAPIKMELDRVDMGLDYGAVYPVGNNCFYYILASNTINGGQLQRLCEKEGLSKFSIVGQTKTITLDINENMKVQIRKTFGWPEKAGL